MFLQILWLFRSLWFPHCVFVDLLLFSCSVVSGSLQPHGLQHTRLPCCSPAPGELMNSCSDSYPLNQWCHLTILSSVVPFFSCLQSFSASGSFPISQFFASGGQTRASALASASILPMNIQEWFPLGLIGLLSFQSKGLSRVFSNTTVQKHQFCGPQPSLWYNSHMHTWLQKSHSFDNLELCWQSNVSAFSIYCLCEVKDLFVVMD